jgi:hypothetical protein
VLGGVAPSSPYATEGLSHDGVMLDFGMGEMNGLNSEFKKPGRVVFGGLTIRMEDK